MKKIYLSLLIILAGSLLFSSCNAWFEEPPKSKINAKNQFNSVTGFQQALTGCYIAMTDNDLYGRNLSWHVVELMARQYELLQYSSTPGISMQDHNYTAAKSQEIIEQAWLKAYNVIANVNLTLSHIDNGVLDPINYSIIKGELLAIRAYMHFEIMRLFGYGDWAHRSDLNTRMTIPYVTVVNKNLVPQKSYTETFALLVKDVGDALLLLEIDPVTKKHNSSYYDEVNEEGYFKNRRLHLNYYAVKALKARIYLWEGSSASKTIALQAATEVVEDGFTNLAFTWATNSSVNNDKVMTSEHLFSLDVNNLTDRVTGYFFYNFTSIDNSALYMKSDRMNTLYETSTIGSADFRRTKLFLENNVGTAAGTCTPLKFGTLAPNVINTVPLIRIPELYYIIAECNAGSATPDLIGAAAALNTVRQMRGILPANDLTGLTQQTFAEQLEKEYRKEYFSEGVMFYFYKRCGYESLLNPDGTPVEMNDGKFMLPYPLIEQSMGRVQ